MGLTISSPSPNYKTFQRSPPFDSESPFCRLPLALPDFMAASPARSAAPRPDAARRASFARPRSEEHTSELQSLMRISYAGFCLQKKTPKSTQLETPQHSTN